jgi:hypothetical protein
MNKGTSQQLEPTIYCTRGEPADTPRDQGNVSDCTGCHNTQVLFLLTEILHSFYLDGTHLGQNKSRVCHGRDCMAVGFITTFAFN